MTGFRIGRVLGIDVRVHGSWFIIAGLVVWSLAAGALPADFPHVGVPGRLAMAAAITLLFFASLLGHELAHSLVATRRGIPVHGITFFLFGGMAHTSSDSRSPGEEFWIAIAGPACSFLLAALFLGLWWAGASNGWSPLLTGSAAYVAVLNGILGVFNLLPGFPMDGGRVLRSVIWKLAGDVTLATRWAARVGVWMALGLVGYGVWQAFTRDVIGGMWLVFIGLFIRNAARMSYRQHVVGRLHEASLQGRQGVGDGESDPHGAAGPDSAGARGLTGRDVTDLRPGEV